MDSLIRLISNKEFAIDPLWGLAEFEKILFNHKYGSTQFEQFKTQSKAIDFYKDQTFTGNDINLIDHGSIAIVSQSGIMTSEDGWCNVGMSTYDTIMRSLYSNSKVDGIIVKQDSGGGYVDAGAIWHNTIADRNKPVVVLSNFLGSAAIMGTLPADEIIAQTNLSEFGSIGVYTTLSKQGLEYYKNNYIDVYSKHSPEKNKDFRDALKGNFETLTESVTKTDEQFMGLVKKYRDIKDKETLLGAMFQAQDAKNRGLIDSVGTLNYSLKRINSLIKNK